MVERAIEGQNIDETAGSASNPEDLQGLFSDQLTEEEKKTLASLKISSDASAERLATLLTTLCRGR